MGKPLPSESDLTANQALAAYLAGLEHFNRGRYFEAHEALEPVYLRTGGETRLFVQALIQLAAACLHLRHQRHRPAGVLLEAARSKLAVFDGWVYGLQVVLVRQVIDGLLQGGDKAVPVLLWDESKGIDFADALRPFVRPRGHRAKGQA